MTAYDKRNPKRTRINFNTQLKTFLVLTTKNCHSYINNCNKEAWNVEVCTKIWTHDPPFLFLLLSTSGSFLKRIFLKLDQSLIFKAMPVTSTSANDLSCKTILFSPARFVWLAHTSSGSFTIQPSVPVYIPNHSLHVTKKHTDLRIQTTR